MPLNRRRFVSLATSSALALAASRARAQAGAVVDPAVFGAVGDGKADDTAALQRALDSLKLGDTLAIAAGKTYRHADVLRVRRAGVRVVGPGTLLATNEEKSAVYVEADDVILEGGLALRIERTSRRWSAPNQDKLHLSAFRGAIVRDVFVDGAAAAGIFMSGASNYLLEDVTVENTRADGIHNTHGSHHGAIRRARVRNVGDDGIAIVSYGQDKGVCHHITIESPRFHGNQWGRGFTVVGGEDVTFRDILCESSNAAAVYVASEGEPWNTFGVRRVQVLGGVLRRSNGSREVDHGAVLLYNARPGHVIEDVTISDLAIESTNPQRSRQVGILTAGSGGVKNIALRRFSIRGGPQNLFVTDAPADRYATSGWTFNGVTRPDHGS